MKTTNKPEQRPGRPRNEWPVFDSMESCSAATGIPLKLIKQAKKEGCDAFQSNRVYLERLLPWLFSQEADESGVDWSSRLAQYKAGREKIKLDKELGLIADRSVVQRTAGKIMTCIFDTLERTFGYELPGSIVGKSESEIATEARRVINELRTRLDKDFEMIGASEESL